MVQKLLMIMAILLLAIPVKAETLKLTEVVSNLPALQAGVGYSMKDSAPVYLGTMDVANYKNFNLEIGYGGRNQESLDEVIGVVSYTLMNQGALNFPILKYVSARAGVYGGIGRINLQDLAGAKLDYGPSLTALFSVKF